MAGTINLALTQQFDMDGNPLSGGLLFFFVASTTTPQTAFQDIALTIPHPNPVVLDASGRVPMFYVADGNIKIRLANKAGVTVIAADNLLVIGPSTGGGGGGGGVDPTTVIATGDVKARFGTGPLAGFVPCNGNTIGNAVSGSTERANADCQALFEYLWSTTVLGVFSGTTANRGATANGDWLANKRIVLPDLRGRTIAGLDNMGSSAAGRLTASFFGASGIVLGNSGGSESKTLTAANLPAHSHSGNTANEATDHTHTWGGSFTTGLENANHAHSWGGTFGTAGVNQSLDHSHSFTVNNLFSPQNATASGGNAPGGNPFSQGGTTAGASSSMDHTHNVSVGGTTDTENAFHAHGVTVSGTSGGRSAAHSHAFTTNFGDGVSGTAHGVANPAMVMTFYIKL